MRLFARMAVWIVIPIWCHGQSTIVLTVKPHEAVLVDPGLSKILHRVPLPGPPAAVASPSPGFVYILVNGGSNLDGSLSGAPSSVVVLDRKTGAIAATIEVGWGASRMLPLDGGRRLAVFRDRPPYRHFERAPSVASGVFSLVRQAKLARKPSAITVIDTSTHAVVWQRSLEEQERDVLYVHSGYFLAPAEKGNVRIFDPGGQVSRIELPSAKADRDATLSASGRWLYILEDGKDSTESRERVKGRVFVIDWRNSALEATIETEHEKLEAFEGATVDGIVIGNQSRLLRCFDGPTPCWTRKIGGDFRYTMRAREGGSLFLVGVKTLEYVDARAGKPNWKWNWGDQLHGEPIGAWVPVPGSQFVAIPAMKGERAVGWNLDRVLLADLHSRQVKAQFIIGRRGRMARGRFFSEMADSFGNGLNPGSFSLVEGMVRGIGDAVSVTSIHNPVLDVSPDGKWAYALSRFGEDLTVLDLDKGAAAPPIPVGPNSLGILRGSSSHLLAVVASKKITWIDTRVNQVASTDKPCQGRFDNVQLDPARNWLATFGEKCVSLWNLRTGVSAGSLEGLGKPRWILPEQ